MIQTWLPLPNFEASVACLTNEHLDAQRVHVLEILEFFHSPEFSQLPKLYKGHALDSTSPIIQMWRGYDLQLIEYGFVCTDEWSNRHGKDDPYYAKFAVHAEWAVTEDAVMTKPNWFGNVDFHLSHQAELLREDKNHYGEHFLYDGDREMVWPKSDYRAAS